MKKQVKKILKKLNLELVNLSPYNIRIYPNRYPHQLIIPRATYAPWLDDQEFLKIYNADPAFKKVDIYRSYELWQLVQESAKLPSGAILEVGVYRGGTGAIIAKAAEKSGIKTTVYLADTFTGVVKASKEDSRYKGGEHADTSEEKVKQLLRSLDIGNVEILKGIFPEDTAHLIKEEQFRFCHIDVDVYQSSKDILEWLWEKILPGGMIVFDDYGFSGTDGVTQVVEEQRTRKDALVLHNLNGHGIIIKY